ncbi:MAG TPA: hypothetical protein V6C76_12895 [Drouetiella sp.]
MKELVLDDLEWAEVIQALQHHADRQKQLLADSPQWSDNQVRAHELKIQALNDLHATAIELTAVSRKGVVIRARE